MTKTVPSSPEKPGVNQWDIQCPPILLHFAPIGLALFCLTLSLSDYSVYLGFEEHQAGTTMSLLLMFFCFFLAFSAMRNPELERSRRWIAGGLTLLLALAMADERLSFHEAFGRYIRRNVRFLPEEITYYTDDVVIIAGAVVGIILLYYCIKYFSDKPDLRQYLWWVGSIAVAHGVLDLISHKRYVWLIFWPNLTQAAFNAVLGERLGCFEEWCKLWTEWFVILFLLRFFFKQKGPLVWSAQIFFGSFLATAGIWNIGNIGKGIPYIMAGKPLHFIRNYHLLVCLVTIWVAWGGITWLLFKQENVKRTIAGLFFVCPLYVLLEEMTSKNLVDGFFHVLSEPVLFDMFYAANMLVFLVIACMLLLPGIALGFSGKYLLRLGLYPILGVLGLLLILYGMSVQGLPLQAIRLLTIGGILLPVIILRLLQDFNKQSVLMLGVIVWALLIQNVFAMVICLMFALLIWLQRIPGESFLQSRRVWIVGVSVHIITVLVIVWLHSPTFIPNVKFLPPPRDVFWRGEQPIWGK